MISSRSFLPLLAAVIGLNAIGAEPISNEYRVGGFVVGCQAYTFKNFTVFEAIEKIAQSGGKAIEFFPKQALSKEQPDVIFNHTAPDEIIQKVKTNSRSIKFLL